jgi:predicted RNase H-like HicB family nuclease
MSDHHFTVIIEREQDGSFHAFCPSLPGCHSHGSSYEETVTNITEAASLYIESLKAHDEPIPTEDMIIKPIHVAA